MCDWCKEIYPEKDTNDIVFHEGKYDRDDFIEPDSFIVSCDDGSFDIVVNPGDAYELGIIPYIKYCPYCGRDLAESEETETWNGIHAQITAPKGTFEKIFNEAKEDENEYEI